MNINENDEIRIDSNRKNKLSTSLFQRKKINLIDLDEDGIFSIDNGKRYIFNSTAMAIWDLIDGHRTAQEITQEIANVCEVKFETIKDDIYGQLAAFQELDLVEEVSAKNHA